MFAVSVSGVVLLFLLQHTTPNTVDGQNIDSNTLVDKQIIDSNTLVDEQIIDSNTLARIITVFQQNYTRVQNGNVLQHAVAINVPKEQCQDRFTEKDFLTNEEPEEWKRNISNKKDPVYEGIELIGAAVKGGSGIRIHSERVLLYPTKGRPTPPMQNLLNKGKDSCTVFYTLNSPCARICLNETSPYNILHGLETWSNHSSIKALVFKQIYNEDYNVIEMNLRKILKHVPVYRCINETENVNVCYTCRGRNDTIDKHCLSNIN